MPPLSAQRSHMHSFGDDSRHPQGFGAMAGVIAGAALLYRKQFIRWIESYLSAYANYYIWSYFQAEQRFGWQQHKLYGWCPRIRCTGQHIWIDIDTMHWQAPIIFIQYIRCHNAIDCIGYVRFEFNEYYH